MSDAPVWFVGMCAAYVLALILWGCALREVNRTGGGFSLLMAGWVAWAVGVATFLVGSAA